MFFERQIFISYTANKALFQALSQPVAEVIKFTGICLVTGCCSKTSYNFFL